MSPLPPLPPPREASGLASRGMHVPRWRLETLRLESRGRQESGQRKQNNGLETRWPQTSHLHPLFSTSQGIPIGHDWLGCLGNSGLQNLTTCHPVTYGRPCWPHQGPVTDMLPEVWTFQYHELWISESYPAGREGIAEENAKCSKCNSGFKNL